MFVTMPTGYGKSYCYTLLPVVFEWLRNTFNHHHCLSISPLTALTMEQTCIRLMPPALGTCSCDRRQPYVYSQYRDCQFKQLYRHSTAPCLGSTSGSICFSVSDYSCARFARGLCDIAVKRSTGMALKYCTVTFLLPVKCQLASLGPFPMLPCNFITGRGGA